MFALISEKHFAFVFCLNKEPLLPELLLNILAYPLKSFLILLVIGSKVPFDPITNSVRKLLSGYARIFNNTTGRSGSLFRQKTKAKCLSDIKGNISNLTSAQDYYINCFHYIHQNPLRAKLVTHLEDWTFSSFKDYANFRNGSLCKKELAKMYCSYSHDTFLTQSYELIPEEVIKYLK